MDYTEIGRRLRQGRRAMGVTQEKLAGMVGISTSFLGHIERGTRKASIETLVNLCAVLDLSLDEVLTSTPPQRHTCSDEGVLLKTIHEMIEDWLKPD